MTSSLTKRETYHHGDLRNALIAAGAKLAERGGPDAVGVRAAAREVGVTPTAAYRHFANAAELEGAVKSRCLEIMANHIGTELAKLPETGDPAQDAVARLMAVGRGYVQAALSEPGMFRTAFSHRGVEGRAGLPPRDDTTFGLLSGALDDLVAVGYLPPERRPYAEVPAWSAVHGLSYLLLDGPLRNAPDEIREQAIERTLDMAVRGL